MEKRSFFLLLKISLLLATMLFMAIQPTVNAGIAEGISFTHEFDDGKIVFKTTYWTDYPPGKWKITDNKNIHIKLEVIEQPENATLFVEHMHADCFIEATKQPVDGLLQDTMDDKIHGGIDQPGFYISKEYPYEEIFSIEGYSKFLIEGWGFVCQYYGWSYVSETRLTEDRLKEVGAIGSELVFVFDICVKYEGEEFYHKIIFEDDFIVYFNGDFVQNIGGEAEEEGPKTEIVFPYAKKLTLPAIIGFIILLIGLFMWGGSEEEDMKSIGKALAIIGFIILLACMSILVLTAEERVITEVIVSQKFN